MTEALHKNRPLSNDRLSGWWRSLIGWLRALFVGLERPTGKTLAVIAACVLAWVCLTALVRRAAGADDFYGIQFALAAVILSAWIGGALAGLVVTGLLVLLMAGVMPETRVVTVRSEAVWHIVVFSSVALLVSSFEESTRRLQQRLQDEVDYKNTFLTLMAHELRTPATVISGGIRLLRLRGDQLSPQETQEVVHEIETESERFAEMVDDILILARLEANKGGFDQLVQLPAVLNRTLEKFREQNPTRTLQLDIPEAGATILGQERYLEVVLRHLLANAEAHSPAAASLIIKLSAERTAAIVSVRDFGPGLPKAELRSLFDPYHNGRVAPAGTRGIMLGLTICRQIVEAMNGSMVAASPEGGGLEISFSLPLAT